MENLPTSSSKLNIPEPVKNVLDAAANEYTNSPSTTNAGFILRFICRFLKPSTIIKMFAHKIADGKI